MMAQYSLPFCVALAHHRDARDPASFNAKIVQRSGDPLARLAGDDLGGGRGQARPHHRLDRHGHAEGRPRAHPPRRQLQGHAGAAARPRRDAREIPAADPALRSRGDGAAVRAAAEHRRRTQSRLDQGRRGEKEIRQAEVRHGGGASARRKNEEEANERHRSTRVWLPPSSSPSPTRRSVSPTAAWSRSRPRPSTASAPTPPTAPPSRGSTPPRAGRRSIR